VKANAILSIVMAGLVPAISFRRALQFN